MPVLGRVAQAKVLTHSTVPLEDGKKAEELSPHGGSGDYVPYRAILRRVRTLVDLVHISI